jgi:LAO/AO transport system kinase
MLVCEAAGFDVVLIETVGVGQSETMVADMTDCFLALMLPGAGDELQGIKRGLLELADVIAVNKADGATRLAAEVAARQYTIALNSLAAHEDDHAPIVLTCSALENEGVDNVWDAIVARYTQIKSSCKLAERWMWSTIDETVKQSIRKRPQVKSIREDLERNVLSGALPPEAAARKILRVLGFNEIGDSQ